MTQNSTPLELDPNIPLTAEEQARAHAKLQEIYEKLKSADKIEKHTEKILALFKEESKSSKNLSAKADILFASPDFQMSVEEIKKLFDYCASTLQPIELKRFKYLKQNADIKKRYDIQEDPDFFHNLFQAQCLNGSVDTIKFFLKNFRLSANPQRFYKSIGFALQMGRPETAIYLLKNAEIDFPRSGLLPLLQNVPATKPELQVVAQKIMLSTNVFAHSIAAPFKAPGFQSKS